MENQSTEDWSVTSEEVIFLLGLQPKPVPSVPLKEAKSVQLQAAEDTPVGTSTHCSQQFEGLKTQDVGWAPGMTPSSQNH